LDDMLAWAMNWLAPTPAQLEWLGPEQRAEMWKPRTPMPLSKFRREMDGTTHYDYAFGFRLADVDGQETVSHTGTLGGMYSMMMVVLAGKSWFVFVINAAAYPARTVLGTALAKRFTAPADERGCDDFADAIDGPKDAPATAEAAGEAPALPDPAARKAV